MKQIDCKRINTKELWKSYKIDNKEDKSNICIEEEGLKLKSTYTYEFDKDILEDTSIDISDIAVDECDIIYVIDKNENQILTYDANRGVIEILGCKPGVLPVSLDSPSAIAIDRDTIYIADKSNDADKGNDRLIALARSNLQVRWIQTQDSEGDPLKQVTDLAIGPKGTIYVLEKNRILRLTRGGKISVPEDIPKVSLLNASAVAVDRDEDIYILDGKAVRRFFFEDKAPKRKHKKISVEGLSPSGLTVDDKKQIFVGESPDDKPPEQKTIHKFALDTSTKPLWTPLWSYRGATRRLINDSKGNLYVINHKGSKLTFLKYTEIYVGPEGEQPTGTYVSSAIDSQKPKTRWHRFLLEGKFKTGTWVEFSYFASDDLVPHDQISWQKGLSDLSSIQGEERRDALFQGDIQGQFLWFKISLTGDRKRTPVVKSLTIFFPRITYLDYLPATYQEDKASKEFLERFVSIFESVVSEKDYTIDHITAYFDAQGVPPEFLSWLGSWLALSVDENWPEETRRQLIQKAISLYKRRGTRAGLEEMIELYSNHKPYIVENFQKDRLSQKKENKKHLNTKSTCTDKKFLFFPPEGIQIKKCVEEETARDTGEEKRPSQKLWEVLFGGEFCFCVLLKDAVLNQGTLNTIKRIIEDQKPAHTCHGLKALQPWFYLDMHTYLEVNTALTKPKFVLGKTSVIGRDTILDDLEQGGQVQRHSRIEIDAKLT